MDDKGFEFKVTRDIGFIIEGTFTIWATSKRAAKKIFKERWSSYTILSIKKIK